MVDIQLDEDNWLVSDVYSYKIGEKYEYKSGIQFKARTYHRTLEQALKEYVNHKIRVADVTEWKQVIEVADETKKTVDKIYNEIMEMR